MVEQLYNNIRENQCFSSLWTVFCWFSTEYYTGKKYGSVFYIFSEKYRAGILLPQWFYRSGKSSGLSWHITVSARNAEYPDDIQDPFLFCRFFPFYQTEGGKNQSGKKNCRDDEKAAVHGNTISFCHKLNRLEKNGVQNHTDQTHQTAGDHKYPECSTDLVNIADCIGEIIGQSGTDSCSDHTR